MALNYLAAAGVDMERLKSVVQHRIRTDTPSDSTLAPGTPRPDLPGSAEVTQVLKDMHVEARRRNRERLNTLNLLWALMQSDSGPVADILRAAGATPEQVRVKVDSAL